MRTVGLAKYEVSVEQYIYLYKYTFYVSNITYCQMIIMKTENNYFLTAFPPMGAERVYLFVCV